MKKAKPKAIMIDDKYDQIGVGAALSKDKRYYFAVMVFSSPLLSSPLLSLPASFSLHLERLSVLIHELLQYAKKPEPK